MGEGEAPLASRQSHLGVITHARWRPAVTAEVPHWCTTPALEGRMPATNPSVTAVAPRAIADPGAVMLPGDI